MTVAEAALSAVHPSTPILDLDRLLRPRSIAIVGAQPEPTSIGGGVLGNLEAFHYAGEIHLVSRSRDEIRGRPCVKSIAELPRDIDVAVLIVPQAAILDSVRACVERGIGAVVVFASGFAEAGDEGRQQQDELAELCRDSGIALLGPNCMGYTNYPDGIPLTFEPVDVRPLAAAGKRVAVVAQSGATAANIRFAMHARGIDVSYVIATGNEATLGAEHFIDVLIHDPQNAAIGCYVEQIRNPGLFLDAARRARAKGIPIVLLHPGSSARGRAAAQSHTGALAGDHAVMETILRNEAIALVETTDELFDVLAILSRFPTPVPGKAGVVTNSGAIRGLCFDFCERIGLDLATLSPEIEAEMQALVPPYVHVDNPFDIGTVGFANPAIYGTSVAVLLKQADIGMALLSYAGGSPKMQIAKSDAIIPVYAAATKPVILNIVGDDYPLDEKFMADVRASGIPFFRSPERALRAMAAISAYADALAATGEPKPLLSVEAIVPGSGVIPEYAGKRVLADLGIAVPRGEMARSVEDAVGAAARIGYPVVIKAQAAALAHKSDVGGVIINIADEKALRSAWDRLHAGVSAAKPGLALDGVLIEEMAQPGLEMVVGARRDPQWGPVVLVGLGGVWIEAIRDARLLPAATTRERVIAELGKLKAASLLGPFRGQPARDVGAIADVVVKLGQLMLSDPSISEVDINPLMVGAEGAVALDALFVKD
ncbi:acetate--CoA ligase family protein [Tianweitania sp. Rool2]|uniref:Acetate--CoA ligase family protein n=1 Tax=Oryzicola mucosus TaxID=2767425 RepID=A0A8J6PNV0_9HYPH|nr:acetate--CoA ligase family protein [Oryzicola mucosus]MBD0417021.1 acetate--CoA ligase family protein [Oryzicola mucosus]